MISKRQFHEEKFYKWCVRNYDEARLFLKSCGKPDNEEKRFWIDYYREQARFFKAFLDD